jgi:hypothetical protein
VLCLVTAVAQPSGECRGKLRIDEEPHSAASTTAWSACAAA